MLQNFKILHICVMRKYLALLLLIFTAVTGFYFFLSWHQLPQGHRVIYPLDDVYIHLALARNFAEFGSWSINTSGFDSASSSILYTVMLSGLIKIFGDWEYYPLLINVVFGYLTVYAVYRYFKDFYGESELKWAVVLLLPFTVLHYMVLIGMEHSLHLFLTVMAVYFIHKNVESNFSRRDFSVLLIILFFVSIVRFESMFFTVSLAFALVLWKEFLKAGLVLFAGFFAIVLFGLISLNAGGYFFPNSVMIKGSFPSGTHFLQSVWQIFAKGILFNFSFYKWLLFPFIIILIHLIKKYRGMPLGAFFKNETLTIAVVSVGILHSLFAMLKYRYENYIMIGVLLVIVPLISKFFSNFKKEDVRKPLQLMTLGSAVFVIAISLYKFGYHHLPIKYSSRGINEQQVEMSRFLGTYYKGQKVAANDIGAISYFSHVHLLDLVGLGSTEVAKIKVDNKHEERAVIVARSKKFISDYIAKNNYKVAVIYPEWFPGETPKGWIPVASWRISKHYGPAIERIVFYALTPDEVKPLQQNLMKFDRNKNVEQWFYILK